LSWRRPCRGTTVGVAEIHPSPVRPHKLDKAASSPQCALSGPALPDNKRFAVSSNWGNFRGTNAMSFIAQARLSANIVVTAALTAGFKYGGCGRRAGLTFAW